MKYRAIVKEADGWWIGWLVDLPGVNAQERTRAECLKSLRIGAEDMLSGEVAFESGAQMAAVEITDPAWAREPETKRSGRSSLQVAETGTGYGSTSSGRKERTTGTGRI